MRDEFTIPLPPVTKKNSQRIVVIGGRPRIIPSKAYKDYEREAVRFCPELHIDYAVNVKATYYMRTRRKVDLCNLHEALHDVLVTAGTLEDDNHTIIQSTDGSRVLYDKEHPRTEIIIEKGEENDNQQSEGEELRLHRLEKVQ